MILETLAPVGVVGIGLVTLCTLVCYMLWAEPTQARAASEPGTGQSPLVDDDLKYLATAYDCACFAVVPLPMTQTGPTPPAQPTLVLPRFAYPYEHQSAHNPA